MTAPISSQSPQPIQPQTFDQKYRAVSKHTAEISYEETKNHERHNNNGYYDTDYFLDMYHQAAEGGVTEAYIDFARIIMADKPERIEDAVEALKIGAAKGSVLAGYRLANLCMKHGGNFVPENLRPTDHEILEYFENALGKVKNADREYAIAILRITPNAHGIERAVAQLKEKSKLTRPQIIEMLANSYIAGEVNNTPNLAKAIELLEKNRNETVDKRLISIYLKTNSPEGNARAIKILQEHANKNEGWALLNLGLIYYKGVNAQKDDKLAKQYFEEGVKVYDRHLENFAKDLSYDDVQLQFDALLTKDLGTGEEGIDSYQYWNAALDALYTLTQGASSIFPNKATAESPDKKLFNLRKLFLWGTQARLNVINREFNTEDSFSLSRLFSFNTRYARLIKIVNQYRALERLGYITHFTPEEKGAFYRDLGRLEYRLAAAQPHGSKQYAYNAWKKGSDLGDKDCLYYKGICYETGFGVTKDPVQAKEYFTKAAADPNGNKFAKAALEGNTDIEDSLRKEDGIEEINGHAELRLKDSETADRIVASKSWLNRTVAWLRKDENVINITAVALTALTIVGIVVGLIALTLIFPHIMVPIWIFTGATLAVTAALGGVLAASGAAH